MHALKRIPDSGTTVRHFEQPPSLVFVPTPFTRSLRVPVTPANRQFLCAARAAELQRWMQTTERRAAPTGSPAG